MFSARRQPENQHEPCKGRRIAIWVFTKYEHFYNCKLKLPVNIVKIKIEHDRVYEEGGTVYVMPYYPHLG